MIEVSTLSIDQLKELRARIDGILDGPADGMGGLDAAVADMKALREKVADTGKKAVARAVRAFLEAHPEVESLRWTLSTPSFNDGDACEFSVHDVEARFVGATGDEGDCEDGYEDSWSIEYDAKEKGDRGKIDVARDMKSLDALFDESEDAMRATFGDHVRVTVGRDFEARVEEYSHD
jgi:hypothetical protein